MMRAQRRILSAGVLALACSGTLSAHPWHRHDDEPAGRPVTDDDDAAPFRLTATARPGPPDIAAAFAPFVERGTIACRHDDRWFYVESDGLPHHPLMVGIRAWQQQVPLPQPYVGANAWQIPLHPRRAAEPASTRNRFLRGAIAVAVNGVPIFNPLNNRGEDAQAIGELDEHGGHCGRADDYHYHVAPVHLEQVVGKGRPIAYALDGFPVYGRSEPDGSPVRPLDTLGGHEDGAGGYHYHALERYPHLIGGFRGEVVERDGQVDPQPRARGVREALPPLRGATITGFTAPRRDARVLTYEIDGRTGTVEYAFAADGSATFTFTDTAGRVRTESYAPRQRGPGGDRRGGDARPRGPLAAPSRGPQPSPEAAGQRTDREAGAGSGRRARPPAQELAVTSPAVAAGGLLPVTYTCDGAGISPPVRWQAGPRGTVSYALTLWHESPDGVRSYWVVYDIPADVTSLPENARSIGTVGLNDKGRPSYDPMCSKGPGRKDYRLTVHALSARPRLPAAHATRAGLLDAIEGITLATGTLAFVSERRPEP